VRSSSRASAAKERIAVEDVVRAAANDEIEVRKLLSRVRDALPRLGSLPSMRHQSTGHHSQLPGMSTSVWTSLSHVYLTR
jgi:hypothetical protein